MLPTRTYEDLLPTNPRFTADKVEWKDETLSFKTSAHFALTGLWLVQDHGIHGDSLFLSRSDAIRFAQEILKRYYNPFDGRHDV